MCIYRNMDALLGLHGSDIDYETGLEEQCDPIESGWNNCKAFSKAVSIGMSEYMNSDEGKKRRKKVAYALRKRSDEFAVCGNKGNTHSEETKKKIGSSCKKRMTEDQKKLIFELYDLNIGIKTIAKQIGFSPTIVRRYIKNR